MNMSSVKKNRFMFAIVIQKYMYFFYVNLKLERKAIHFIYVLFSKIYAVFPYNAV